MDSADGGAAEVRGYTAAEASHAFEEYLAGRLSLEGFAEWLQGYPYGKDGPSSSEVEDEINLATLAVRALQNGTRRLNEVRDQLRDARGRLSGLARF
ncbi:MAG: hypothetical protein M3442_21560 [Chloroflexota bacterium]|nr:hypothetical protein [Chloroflexota bacterium]